MTASFVSSFESSVRIEMLQKLEKRDFKDALKQIAQHYLCLVKSKNVAKKLYDSSARLWPRQQLIEKLCCQLECVSVIKKLINYSTCDFSRLNLTFSSPSVAVILAPLYPSHSVTSSR